VDRRAFLGALASGLIAAPLAAEAQQAAKTARIGLLFSTTPAAAARAFEAFRQRLRELGYVEGKTVAFQARYAEGRFERLPELARELVGLKVDVIVTATDASVAAVKRETQTIPIVMTNSGDPVGSGFVASLPRPGGNVTGLSTISPELSGKRLELLREVVPGFSRVAFLWNPDVRGNLLDYKATVDAARSLRLELLSVEVSRAEDLDRAFAAITNQHAQALVLPAGNPVVIGNRGQMAGLAQMNRLPSIYGLAEYTEAGGLMSYGPSLSDLFRRAAVYVDRILKGAKPADLPVEQPTKFELVINLKTAKALAGC
jgi:putative tryptophan/tyrosine transport system substrate-binding protein